MRDMTLNELEVVSGAGVLRDSAIGWLVGKIMDATYNYVTDVQPVDMADPINPANVYGA